MIHHWGAPPDRALVDKQPQGDHRAGQDLCVPPFHGEQAKLNRWIPKRRSAVLYTAAVQSPRSPRPRRPPTAPEAHSLARGSLEAHSGPTPGSLGTAPCAREEHPGAPSRHGCRGGTVAALWCLPAQSRRCPLPSALPGSSTPREAAVWPTASPPWSATRPRSTWRRCVSRPPRRRLPRTVSPCTPVHPLCIPCAPPCTPCAPPCCPMQLCYVQPLTRLVQALATLTAPQPLTAPHRPCTPPGSWPSSASSSSRAR